VRRLAIVLLSTLFLGAGAAVAASYPHATICGASKCVALHGSALRILADRNDTYNLLSAVKPAPYYRIDIYTSADFGRRLFWVPSRHVFRVIEGVNAPANSFPPSAPYWRDIPVSLATQLAALVRSLAPRPASHAWH
jgi:hypothetical protein